MAGRINKVVELLEAGQPVYQVGSHTGNELTYEAGKQVAKTFADFVNVGMEHGAFDMPGLDQFMRGLVDGGPTNSGHRTPAVLVEAPVEGSSAEVVRANAWQFRQILARGVHGIFLTHAESPDAVREFVEICRYPFHKQGVGEGLGTGRRGVGSESAAAPVWGLSINEYLEKADVWPLNPDGELLLGVKMENYRAASNADAIVEIPGISLAEWGSGDMVVSFGYRLSEAYPPPPEAAAARDRIMAACRRKGIAYLDGATPENIIEKLDAGAMLGGGNEEAARIGREHTGRTMPV